MFFCHEGRQSKSCSEAHKQSKLQVEPANRLQQQLTCVIVKGV
jgi:hypothetical protein